jgi:hypothetical protein
MTRVAWRMSIYDERRMRIDNQSGMKLEIKDKRVV